MTWIIVSIPLMVLAIAIAVVPVLLTAAWEAHGQQVGRPALAASASTTVRGHAPTREFSDAA
jgi:hypothetical protein